MSNQNRISFATRTADIRVEPGGTIFVQIRGGLTQSVEDAEKNIIAAANLAGGVRTPIVVDVSRSETLSADVRHHYSGSRVTGQFDALALVIDASPVGRVIGNLYFSVAKLDIPVKLFTDLDSALNWAQRYRHGS